MLTKEKTKNGTSLKMENGKLKRNSFKERRRVLLSTKGLRICKNIHQHESCL